MALVPPDAAPTAPSEAVPSLDYAGDTVRNQAQILLDRAVHDARTNTVRVERDRQDWLNLLYYRGGVENQWVIWDRATASWVPRPYDGTEAALPDWVPRATTNIFRTKIDGICAILDQSAPSQEWLPGTDDDNDLAAAQVVNDAMPVLRDEIEYESLRAQIHKQIVLTDKVAVCVYYDNDPKYGSESIQAEQCTTCGALVLPMELEETNACPECGGTTFMPAFDPMNQPVGAAYPKGKLCAHIIPSFEFSLPSSARWARESKVPWILLHTREDKQDVLRWWPQAKDVAETRSGAGSGGLQRHFADNMKNIASPRAARAGGAGTHEPDGPVVYRLYHDPIVDDEVQFPDGLFCVSINGQIIECQPLPYKDDAGQPLKNVLIRTFSEAPGSPYNSPPADDLVPLQYWRNLIESLIALVLMHDAAPRTFIPATVTLVDEITGQAGQQIRFRSHMPGERPFTEPGVNPPESLFKYLELLDAKFEEVSHLNAVLMGNRPQGDPTLGEVQILQERGMASFKTPLDCLVDFETRLSRMLLSIARQSAWSPRFRKIRGENGQWEVTQFAGTDLRGRVDIRSEPSSAWPRSPLMDQLRMKEAVGMGVIIPQMDPELSAKILTRMNLTELKPSLDTARKQVARQLDRWKAAKLPQEIEPPGPDAQLWNLPLHIQVKTDFLLTEEVEHLKLANPPVYMAMLQHVLYLQQMIQMQQMQQMQAQAAAQAPPEAQPPTGEAVNEAVESGAMQPAEATQGEALNEAVDSGVLQPAGIEEAMQQAQLPSIDDLLEAQLLQPVIPEEGQAPGGPASQGPVSAPPSY